ncbi:alpha-ketoglutarate-dependent dioxygenase AlkB [Microscilla marina]|uniref:Alkylated DNA repair protein n=1 Tax=Microscilla marina ATCC 23134 TaxID=313606 RepID=A1ZED9_MICM2|nr:alpha-ketoglutarate-dependent dioxygenase AlkB [Microscilla marina]EAY31447.1 alkylated DNA repair protein [Microscilla marina ATCC 23134]
MNHLTQSIPGLQYIPDFVGQTTQTALIEAIDALPWLTDLKRRVQHYGYKYDYKKRAIDASMKVGDLPHWAQKIVQQAVDEQLLSEYFDQMIINEYLPGQGIARHVDCEPCFDHTIMSVSLGTACVMHFNSLEDKNLDVPVLLAPGSAILLSGDARYRWQHSIRANKSEMFEGQKIVRGRRVSLTFRKVIIQT